jgi:hypothetical protein
MSTEHPAAAAAARSRAAVMSKNKDAWLALFADDICIEDPIGVSPVDPSGEGIRGADKLSGFWDKNIAPNDYTFTVHHSYAAGSEVAVHMTLDIVMAGAMTGQVNGIFTYRLDDQGKIDALRGYWELEAMMKTLKRLS